MIDIRLDRNVMSIIFLESGCEVRKWSEKFKHKSIDIWTRNDIQVKIIYDICLYCIGKTAILITLILYK